MQKLLTRLGYVRVDATRSSVVDTPAAAVEAHARLQKVQDGGPLPAIDLALDPRQKLAMYHPFRRGASPAPVCFVNERYDAGWHLVHSLWIGPAEGGRYFVWTAIVTCFRPTHKGDRPVKPVGGMRGVVVTKAQELLNGAGQLARQDSWQNGGNSFVLSSELTAAEMREFERLHGQIWISQALASVRKPLTLLRGGDNGEPAA